jgi:hypothetical protein
MRGELLNGTQVNTNTAMGTAVYVWDGMVWNPVQPIPVTSVSLDKPSLTFTTYDTQTLTPTVMPAGAANKVVTWASSNENVATVSNGVVTPVSGGTATITVTTADGNKTATCAVTASLPYIIPNGVYSGPAFVHHDVLEGKTFAELASCGFSPTGGALLVHPNIYGGG